MNLLQKVLEAESVQTSLTQADGSDAGSTDVSNKINSADVKFSMLRNVINRDGEVTGADVNNWLEKAHEINDDVDTVCFGLEDDDGKIVKVYVNATEADAFEARMAELLGMEDDIEEAVNTLAQDFDIVDVVWPAGSEEEAEDEELDVTLDTAADVFGDDDVVADDEADLAGGEATPAVDEPAEVDAEIEAAVENEPVGDEDAPTEDAPADEDAPDGDDEEGEDGKKKAKKKAKKTHTDGNDLAEDTLPWDVLNSVSERLYEVPFMMLTPEQANTIIDSDETAAVARMKFGSSSLEKLSLNKHELLFNTNPQLLKGKAKAALAAISEETPPTGTPTMSLGSSFLKRVLTEATDKDGVKDGFSVPLDFKAKMLVSKLPRGLEDQLVALLQMAGVDGNALMRFKAADTISAAADRLRTEALLRRLFKRFYTKLATIKGYTLKDDAPAQVAEAADDIQGPLLERIFKQVLVALGMPEVLATVDAPNSVKTALRKTTANFILQDAGVRTALFNLADALGISKSADAVTEAVGIAYELTGAPLTDKLSKALVANLKKAHGGAVVVSEDDKVLRIRVYSKAGEDKATVKTSADGLQPGWVKNIKVAVVGEALEIGATTKFPVYVELLLNALGIDEQIIPTGKLPVLRQALRAKAAEMTNDTIVLIAMERVLKTLGVDARSEFNKRRAGDEQE